MNCLIVHDISHVIHLLAGIFNPYGSSSAIWKRKNKQLLYIFILYLKYSTYGFLGNISLFYLSQKYGAAKWRAILYTVCTYIHTWGYHMWSYVVCDPSILVAFITPVELSAKHFHKLNCRVTATHSPGWVNFQLLLIKITSDFTAITLLRFNKHQCAGGQ